MENGQTAGVKYSTLESLTILTIFDKNLMFGFCATSWSGNKVSH